MNALSQTNTPAPRAEIVNVTPAMAADWLKRNSLNRRVRPTLVEWYAGIMKTGAWRLNGETIVLGTDGSLLDGQHRCLGCVKAQAPFMTFVVFEMQLDAFKTLDTGRVRQAADALEIDYRTASPSDIHVDGKRLAAACMWMNRYALGQMSSSKTRRISSAETIEVAHRHPELKQCIQVVNGRKRLRDMAPPSIMAFCYYLFSKTDPILAERFFDGLERGAGLTEDDSIYLLRERLLKDRQAKAKLQPSYIAALLIKAWNATRQDRKMKQLAWRDTEAFPVIE